jgi:hypothetical protein
MRRVLKFQPFEAQSLFAENGEKNKRRRIAHSAIDPQTTEVLECPYPTFVGHTLSPHQRADLA